jgi:hypothetical protein
MTHLKRTFSGIQGNIKVLCLCFCTFSAVQGSIKACGSAALPVGSVECLAIQRARHRKAIAVMLGCDKTPRHGIDNLPTCLSYFNLEDDRVENFCLHNLAVRCKEKWWLRCKLISTERIRLLCSLFVRRLPLSVSCACTLSPSVCAAFASYSMKASVQTIDSMHPASLLSFWSSTVSVFCACTLS